VLGTISAITRKTQIFTTLSWLLKCEKNLSTIIKFARREYRCTIITLIIILNMKNGTLLDNYNIDIIINIGDYPYIVNRSDL